MKEIILIDIYWGFNLEAFERSGFWWLPDDPDNRVAGILHYDPVKGIKLELLGFLKVDDYRVTRCNEFISYVDIILGDTSKGQVTCYQCYQRSRTFFGNSESNFDVSVIFTGHHFEKVDDIVFDRISVKYLNLERWVAKSGFHYLVKNDSDNVEDIKVWYRSPEKRKAKVKNMEISISFKFRPPFGSPPDERNLKQHTYLNIKTDDETHFDKFKEEILFLITQFLTFGVGKAVHLTCIKCYSDSLIYNKRQKLQGYKRVYAYYNVKSLNEGEIVPTHEMLFSFLDIEDNFNKFLNNWFEKGKNLKDIYNLYFATIIKSMYLEHQFLSLIQAIESYHQRMCKGIYLPRTEYRPIRESLINAIPKSVTGYHKESLESKINFGNHFTLQSRLDEIFEKYNDIFGLVIEDKENFIKNVKNTRNFFTHYSKSLEKKAKDGDELVNLTDQIKFVLEVCLLVEIGFSLEKIKNLIAQRRGYECLFIRLEKIRLFKNYEYIRDGLNSYYELERFSR
jgi:hypothetical protein